MAPLKLIRTTRSTMGSGQAEIETYLDEQGNEWTALSGGKPVMTMTTETIAHLTEVCTAARKAGREARGE